MSKYASLPSSSSSLEASVYLKRACCSSSGATFFLLNVWVSLTTEIFDEVLLLLDAIDIFELLTPLLLLDILPLTNCALIAV